MWMTVYLVGYLLCFVAFLAAIKYGNENEQEQQEITLSDVFSAIFLSLFSWIVIAVCLWLSLTSYVYGNEKK